MRHLTVLAIFSLLLLIVGCGGDEADPAGTTVTDESATPNAPGVSDGPAGTETTFDDQTEADPEAVLNAYVASYNAADIDGVMSLFSESSVMTFHPLAPSSAGLSEIRELQMADLDHSAAENAYILSNVRVTGTTVTWDHIWVDNGGVEHCAYGHEAVIENGKILSWAWAPGPFDCQ